MKLIKGLCIVLIALASTVSAQTALKQPLEVSGDVFFRGQTGQRPHSETHDNAVMQLRLFTDFEVQPGLTLDVGLASTGEDPRFRPSFSESFGNNPLSLYRMALVYEADDYTTVSLGKMKNPVWSPGQVLWDRDLNPEGASVVVKQPLEGRREFQGSFSYFVIEDFKDKASPDMFALQPSIIFNQSSEEKIRAAFGYFMTRRTKENVLQHSAGTNSLDGSGALANRFSTYTLTLEYERLNSWIYLPTRKRPIFAPLFKAHAEYLNNVRASRDGQGYSLGLTVGDQKLTKGNRQYQVIWRHIQADAWLDILPDSNAYYGSTDIEGYSIRYQYGLEDNMTLGLNFFSMDRINAVSNAEQRIQVDLALRF